MLSRFQDTSDFATWARRLIPHFLAGLGIALMGLGILISYIQSNRNTAVTEKSEGEVTSVGEGVKQQMVKIEAAGAVERPGVYDLPYDSRVKDVLIAAGGLVAKADRNYLSKNINLAQRVTDGTKIYFPFVNEANFVSGVEALNAPRDLSSLVNINSASIVLLDSLPGIGPVTAGKIIAARPYQGVSELVSRKIVSQSVFDKIRDKISVN